MHFFSFRDSPPILYKASEGSEASEIKKGCEKLIL
jgi:hypothetical protein